MASEKDEESLDTSSMPPLEGDTKEEKRIKILTSKYKNILYIYIY